jgi:hypothetical protein
MRYWLHMGETIDSFWTRMVNGQFTDQWNSMGADPQTIGTLKAILLSDSGRAGWILFTIGFVMVLSLGFAAAGGALSARLGLRRRQSR